MQNGASELPLAKFLRRLRRFDVMIKVQIPYLRHACTLRNYMQNDSSALTPPDDAELMQLIAGRNSEALRLLYQRHAGLMLALCMRITRSRADAEDVILDVFQELWQRADRYDPLRASPLTYLTMVTRSRALDFRRAHPASTARDATEQSYAANAQTVNSQSRVSVTVSNPLGNLLADETRASVQSALGGLSNEERELIEYCYFDGMTHSQIAERTHQPLGTIKTRIRRGLARLRGRLRLVWDERLQSPEDLDSAASNGIVLPLTEKTTQSIHPPEIPQSTPGPEVV